MLLDLLQHIRGLTWYNKEAAEWDGWKDRQCIYDSRLDILANAHCIQSTTACKQQPRVPWWVSTTLCGWAPWIHHIFVGRMHKRPTIRRYHLLRLIAIAIWELSLSLRYSARPTLPCQPIYESLTYLSPSCLWKAHDEWPSYTPTVSITTHTFLRWSFLSTSAAIATIHFVFKCTPRVLSLIHISEPTRQRT